MTITGPVFVRPGFHMAAAAEGIDLRQPPSPAVMAALRRALRDHQVLCIRGQEAIGLGAFLATLSLFERRLNSRPRPRIQGRTSPATARAPP